MSFPDEEVEGSHPSLFTVTLEIGKASDASCCRDPVFTFNELFIQ